jgi:hypothetical protein
LWLGGGGGVFSAIILNFRKKGLNPESICYIVSFYLFICIRLSFFTFIGFN